jgi:hypothetical protein
MTEENNYKPKDYNGYIIGINIGVLAVYTILSKMIEGGVIIDAFLIAGQFFICLIMGIVVRKWVWVLTAFLILLIGFSTCVSFLDMQL